MSVMNIDFDKLRIILLPHALRQSGLIEAMLTAMYMPLKRMQSLFVSYEARENRERRYGPTVRQLKQAIANLLSIDESLVKIEDVANRDMLDLRRQSDGAATRLALGAAALILWSDDMVWWNREFTVGLPTAYNAFEPKVKTVLDRWKMAGSRYTLTYYSQI